MQPNKRTENCGVSRLISKTWSIGTLVAFEHLEGQEMKKRKKKVNKKYAVQYFRYGNIVHWLYIYIANVYCKYIVYWPHSCIFILYCFHGAKYFINNKVGVGSNPVSMKLFYCIYEVQCVPSQMKLLNRS